MELRHNTKQICQRGPNDPESRRTHPAYRFEAKRRILGVSRSKTAIKSDPNV